jgi:adenylate cyclase
MAGRDDGVQSIAASNFASALISGDIIVEADDIYGDGVNLAARLEALAEPGGIFVAVLFMMPLVRRPRSIPMSPGH